MKTAKKEFEELVFEGMRSLGLDGLSSKLIAILYSEPDHLTLQDLTEKTGYSFSAVSAGMKMLARMRVVETTRKRGSKKLYFTAQRDMLKLTLDSVKAKTELMVAPAIQSLPAIIQKCKKTKGSERLVAILEQYQQQMAASERILKNLAKFTKKMQKEVRK